MEKIRVLLAKPGLDEHTWGAMVVAQGLRDEGMEVIYLEMATPDQIAQVAIQEDVQVVGLSISSGAHPMLLPKIARLLKEKGHEGALIIAGGNIPRQDVQELKDGGIDEVFGPGMRVSQIAEYIRNSLEKVA